MKNKQKLLVPALSIALCFLVFILLFQGVAYGAQYAVSPLLIDKELEKRDIVTETITITNNEQRKIRIFPTVNEVSVNEGGSIKGFMEPSMVENKGTSITSWIEISRGRIELMPGEQKELTVTIRVNPEVEAGEYHAFIGFPEGSNRPEAEKIVYSGSSPGTIVRIGVDKVQNQFLRLASFSVERFIKNTDEGKAQFTLANPGSDPVIPSGEIIFYDNRGNEVGAVPINEANVTIPPNQETAFVSEVPKTLKMGKYKAFLSVEYGEHKKTTLNDTAFFYVIPLKHVIVIFAIILLLAISLALYIHRRYDIEHDDHTATDIALYMRSGKSESKDHDIDLSKKRDENI